MEGMKEPLRGEDMKEPSRGEDMKEPLRGEDTKEPLRGEGMTEPLRGWCEPEIQQELPGLGVVSLAAEAKLSGPLTGGSPARLLARLRTLSNRWRGARAINVRQEPVPSAYRVFFRHIGLDPDVTRTPIEAAVLERMIDGGFLSKGALADVLTIVLLDTGVPVWALDADALAGPLGVRLSRVGERLGRAPHAPSLGAGQLVLADRELPVGLLFGEIAASHAPRADSRRLVLFAVQVAGVPLLHVEEALWGCRSLLEGR
jgi:DNA/RNA-binding domain of Phe-tRNA-synthetase-like protein